MTHFYSDFGALSTLDQILPWSGDFDTQIVVYELTFSMVDTTHSNKKISIFTNYSILEIKKD